MASFNLRLSDELNEKLTNLADEKYSGNRSMVAKLAIEEFIETQDADSYAALKDEVAEIKNELLLLKSSLQQVLSQLSPSP